MKKKGHNNYGIERCQFCEMGVHKRAMVWRMVKNMSKKDMIKLLKEKKIKKRFKNGKRKT